MSKSTPPTLEELAEWRRQTESLSGQIHIAWEGKPPISCHRATGIKFLPDESDPDSITKMAYFLDGNKDRVSRLLDNIGDLQSEVARGLSALNETVFALADKQTCVAELEGDNRVLANRVEGYREALHLWRDRALLLNPDDNPWPKTPPYESGDAPTPEGGESGE